MISCRTSEFIEKIRVFNCLLAHFMQTFIHPKIIRKSSGIGMVLVGI